MMDTRSFVSTRSLPRSTSSTVGNLPLLKLKETEIVRSSQLLTKAGRLPAASDLIQAIRETGTVLRLCRDTQPGQRKSRPAIDSKDLRNWRGHSKAKVRATPSSCAAPFCQSRCTRLKKYSLHVRVKAKRFALARSQDRNISTHTYRPVAFGGSYAQPGFHPKPYSAYI